MGGVGRGEARRLKERAFQLQRDRERRKTSLLLATVVLICAFAIYFASQIEPVKKQFIYPYPYQDLVVAYSKANGVPSSLVASVIMHESKFKSDVRSSRGAVGLMQIMPETAKWIAGELEDASFSVERLSEPEMNIRYGTWYLAHLLREFEGNPVLALAAYNAGRGTVHDWMTEEDWDMDFSRVEDIPYSETRLYVKRVLKDRQHYEKLYRESGKG